MTFTEQMITIAIVVLGTMATRFLPCAVFRKSIAVGDDEFVSCIFLATCRYI